MTYMLHFLENRNTISIIELSSGQETYILYFSFNTFLVSFFLGYIAGHYHIGSRLFIIQE